VTDFRCAHVIGRALHRADGPDRSAGAEFPPDRGLRAFHIERAEELQPGWFAEAEVVGLTAGTSTLKETVAAAKVALERIAQARRTPGGAAKAAGEDFLPVRNANALSPKPEPGCGRRTQPRIIRFLQ